ncbi:MAG TPA: nicotinate-nucleotide adenylyltransferase [Thermoanaerobaculia bacterium]|nr:nicotinate-nucleotide adenylyltransferase [Thermoanaerobaculia bacterium]
MRLGICGGSFDPFHRGHLDPVLAARATMQWDRILYVPACLQPFKPERAIASAYDRFAMAVLATESRDDLGVSKLELERGSISYSVETLEALRTEMPNATFDWIIGDDNLSRLDRWKSIDRIFELANFVVLSRLTSGAGEVALVPELLQSRIGSARARSRCGTIIFAENRTVPVSSTEIRERVRDGRPIDEFVDPRVSRYIHQYQLYREAHS